MYKCSSRNIRAFCRNTVEISENSEDHLKAIVGRRQVDEGDGVRSRARKVVKKTQGEGKAAKNGARGWQSGTGSADCIELREGGRFSQ
jgi:hypothetical protein